jgi:hypothetical protein
MGVRGRLFAGAVKACSPLRRAERQDSTDLKIVNLPHINSINDNRINCNQLVVYHRPYKFTAARFTIDSELHSGQ